MQQQHVIEQMQELLPSFMCKNDALIDVVQQLSVDVITRADLDEDEYVLTDIQVSLTDVPNMRFVVHKIKNSKFVGVLDFDSYVTYQTPNRCILEELYPSKRINSDMHISLARWDNKEHDIVFSPEALR